MKKLLLSLIILISLVSCTSEELPKDFNISSTKHKYMIDWDSNSNQSSLDIEVYRKGVKVTNVTEITDKHIQSTLIDEDSIVISINNKQITSNPELYLAIYRYKNMDLSSNSYNPDKMDLIYEKEYQSNNIKYSATVVKGGELKE